MTNAARINSILSCSSRAMAHRLLNPSSRRTRDTYYSRNTASRKELSCSCCGARLGSWCAKWPMTVRASSAISAHQCVYAVRAAREVAFDQMLDLTGDAQIAALVEASLKHVALEECA